ALLLCFAKRQKANRRLHQAGRKPALSGVTVFFGGDSASRWRGSRWLYRGRTHARSAPVLRLKETERIDVVADQQVLGLLVVVEHHLVGLATHAGLLVAAERRMRGIQVVAVGPDAAGLDPAPHAIGAV